MPELSQEEKQRIYQEEKVRLEAQEQLKKEIEAREKARQEAEAERERKQHNKNALKGAALLGLIVLAFIYAFVDQESRRVPPPPLSAEEQKAKNEADTRSSFAALYGQALYQEGYDDVSVVSLDKELRITSDQFQSGEARRQFLGNIDKATREKLCEVGFLSVQARQSSDRALRLPLECRNVKK
jgi:hypothetical protein